MSIGDIAGLLSYKLEFLNLAGLVFCAFKLSKLEGRMQSLCELLTAS